MNNMNWVSQGPPPLAYCLISDRANWPLVAICRPVVSNWSATPKPVDGHRPEAAWMPNRHWPSSEPTFPQKACCAFRQKFVLLHSWPSVERSSRICCPPGPQRCSGRHGCEVPLARSENWQKLNCDNFKELKTD